MHIVLVLYNGEFGCPTHPCCFEIQETKVCIEEKKVSEPYNIECELVLGVWAFIVIE